MELTEYTTVCGYFGAYALTPTYISQMIARLRRATRIFLSLDIQGRRQPDTVSHIYRECDDAEGIELHRVISGKIRAHRVLEMSCPLHAVLWYLQERGAHVEPLEINDPYGYLDDLKDARNDTRKVHDNAIVNAAPMCELDFKRFERGEHYPSHEQIERYRISRVFKLKSDEPVTLRHLRLYRKDRTLVSKFMARACLLYLDEENDNPVKGRFREGADLIFRILKPVRELCKKLSYNVIEQLQEAIRTGKWVVIDETALSKAVFGSARFLKEHAATATLIPDGLNTAQRGGITDSQRQAIIGHFKRVFLPDEKDAVLCQEAIVRYMEPLLEKPTDRLGTIKPMSSKSKGVALRR